MLIASDLDGTLLNDEKRVEYKTQHWITEYLEKGNVFATITSRNLDDVLKVIPWLAEQKHWKWYIAYNEGAHILSYDSSQIQKLAQLKGTNLNDLIRECSKHVKTIVIFTDEEIITLYSNRLTLMMVKVKSKLRGEKNMSYSSIWSFIKINPEVAAWKIKLGLWQEDSSFELYKKMKETLFNYCVTLNENKIEIMHKNSGKLGALKMIAAKEKIELEDVIYFGDEGNDVYCLNSTNSYAMDNAPDWIKREAKNITDNNNNQGVLQVLQKLGI